MSSEGEARANRRGEPRVPFDGSVRLRYRLFQEFLEENGANISAGGMFIRTIHPGELGSELDFEIRLDDDFTLVQGRGQVAWIRQPDDEPGAEPGMGIRFIELGAESRALVDKIVRERVAAGLELFDLESHAPVPPLGVEGRSAVPVPRGSDSSPIWELSAESATHADPAGHGGGAGQATDAPADLENVAAPDPELPRPAASGASGAGNATPTPAHGAGAAGRSSPSRLLAVAVLSALVGAGAVLTFYWFFVQPSIDALEMRIDELAGSPGGPWQPPSEEPDTVEATAVDGRVDETATFSEAGGSDDVVDALRGWAAAWSSKDPDGYLAYYAAGFRPADGSDRSAWEAARRARIDRPQWIRVALTLVQVESMGPDGAEVAFVQSYQSERYKDLVRKRMTMVREDGAWKIAAERAMP